MTDHSQTTPSTGTPRAGKSTVRTTETASVEARVDRTTQALWHLGVIGSSKGRSPGARRDQAHDESLEDQFDNMPI
ncbi:hypothetical protein [Puniceibacterium sp. IMCC21224]|uniref:hypothetical protein n=1 Tax=Puniceibacterium sp. IMCC21224 TaxID=1618204 RepID=UPI00065CE05E|nr:hypothetical protein [Puniceibacterium sp. IMCC21224]KMK66521.1 hypothetical protein IMCC21224_111373 [Puniceibacterium sp. IMCC21224]